jgi:lipopolysaccharide transport system ATP-binding protein
MRKKEISRKFDEIVDFSGIERYIDTPVKRYSSGMYVRLAFAVAAYLESEILIVDEVLAVGDAEFQKKCLGKMNNISTAEGRTILFVSHNMGAIRTLCNTGMLLHNGNIQAKGSIDEIVNQYIKSSVSSVNAFNDMDFKRTGSGAIIFKHAEIMNAENKKCNEFFVGDEMKIVFDISNPNLLQHSAIGIQVKTMDDIPLLHMMNRDSAFEISHSEASEQYEVKLSEVPLFPGDYKITLTIADSAGHEIYDDIEGCLSFTVLQGGKKVQRNLPRAAGLFFVSPQWQRKT